MKLTSSLTLCAIAGLGAVLLVAVTGTADAQSARRFFTPLYLGQPVAFCLDGNNDCGKSAAAVWCHTKGYDEVLNYARRAMDAGVELRFVDTGNSCNSGDCIGFSQIKCMRLGS